MRDRFSELIKKGVASFQEKPVGSPTPTLDPMVRAYNNLWGALTDTHMSAVEDGYIITGTFVKSPYWDRFKYCGYWGTTNIKLGSGYTSLENMVYTNGYTMTPDIYNSDYVIKLTKNPDPSINAPEGIPCEGDCSIGCTAACPCVVSLGESQIPHPFKEFFTEAQTNDIINAWNDAKGNANKIIENLKSSREVNADKFRITADKEYMMVDERMKIKLN